ERRVCGAKRGVLQRVACERRARAAGDDGAALFGDRVARVSLLEDDEAGALGGRLVEKDAWRVFAVEIPP
ncbi:MAG: hypothetical protein LBK73_16690, partial [Treponema sp.]|nr:hypothetical protein [Treponema sp.]